MQTYQDKGMRKTSTLTAAALDGAKPVTAEMLREYALSKAAEKTQNSPDAWALGYLSAMFENVLTGWSTVEAITDEVRAGVQK